VFNSVIVAITGRAKQLFYVALMILALLVIYAVLSYAFLSSFFDLSSYQYCRTLWECLVTIIREGLLDTFGGNIQVNYVNQDGPDFNVYLWRSFFDLLFYIVITIIALNVITAIFVDAFSELRADTEKALQDQKDVCFICGIPNDTFEREGVKGRGFREHYKYDHNVYDYIYYVLYIRSMPTKDHNAIEKYVYEMVRVYNYSVAFLWSFRLRIILLNFIRYVKLKY
jgi:inositol 1,4,5-triphosphate receptor type 1